MTPVMEEKALKTVRCPECKKQDSAPERGVWPFCSERCKALDLGAWAAEKYRVPTRERPSEHDDEN